MFFREDPHFLVLSLYFSVHSAILISLLLKVNILGSTSVEQTEKYNPTQRNRSNSRFFWLTILIRFAVLAIYNIIYIYIYTHNYFLFDVVVNLHYNIVLTCFNSVCSKSLFSILPCGVSCSSRSVHQSTSSARALPALRRHGDTPRCKMLMRQQRVGLVEGRWRYLLYPLVI